MFEVNTMNPYSFDGFNYKYSASTGDYIKGVMFDISTANMIVNSFGIFYFLYQRKYLLSFVCHVVAIYTTSNLGNFILVLFFVSVLILDASKFHKSLILCYLTFAVIFIIKISPSNLHYLNVKAKDLLHLNEKPITTHWHDNSEKDHLISDYVKQKKGDLILKKTSKELVNNLIIEKKKLEIEKQLSEDISAIKERNENRNHFVLLYNSLYADTSEYLYKNYYGVMPGKYLSFVETFNFSKRNTLNFLVGAGAGNFSSKLAYKATNMGFTGRYFENLKYISPEFKDNHLKLSLSYFVQSPDEHSIINFPNSVFNQLLGEYGVIGIFLFFAFYVVFYLKRFKRLTFGKIILPMCLFFLITDYWFESFTIVVIFELMMFIDIAKSGKTKQSLDE
ncbi:hypothetical protein [Aurantibacillus circumpalustris]|uniref:hypothetical protein n=1 Tax=Aurantibacillus circumpalustris TaxID=3036359 RepID=UPI00295A7AB3|nr:hypothetical protein [Aurantibacillus circumpalustris]